MGAEPWSYFVPYREDVAAALEGLKRDELAAGRYHKPWGSTGTHATIEEALAAGDADGTRSILDMGGVAEAPRSVRPGSDPFEFGGTICSGSLRRWLPSNSSSSSAPGGPRGR